MALYAIGDLHLSLGVDKPMDVFGPKWENYTEKLREGLSVITPEDTTVLLGDLSWGMDLQQAEKDFEFINAIPGKKYIIKGNHDYWWTTASKLRKFCAEKGFTDIEVLNNNCFFYEDIALCGSRGWFFEEQKSGEHDEKILNRELIRLETSLKLAQGRQTYCFLHYPPVYRGYRCEPILELLHRYPVSKCIYGHLHSESHKLAITGEYEGILMMLAAADYVNFTPVLLK